MNVCEAIKEHGAKVVYEAAAKRMGGDMDALPRLGLHNTLADAWRIMCEAHRRMTAAEQATDYWGAQQSLNKRSSNDDA